MKQVLQKLEDTAIALLQIEAQDVASLQSLEPELRSLADLLRQHERPSGAHAVRQSADLLASSSEDSDLQSTLDTVTQMMCDLQRALRNDADDSSLQFAAQLMSPRADEQMIACDGESNLEGDTTAADADLSQAFADPEMIAGFISEAREHLETADVELLKLEADPAQQNSLSAVFRSFHTIKGVAGFLGLTRITTVAHEAESLLDRARSGLLMLSGESMDVVFASVDALKNLVAGLAAGASMAGDLHADPQLADLVLRIQRINSNDSSREGAQESQAAAKPAVASTNTDLAPAATTSAAPEASSAAANVAETVKVDRTRLDRLVDMIGELVIAESMVQQELLATSGHAAQASRNVAQLNKITRNLQELGLSLRMVPIRATFQKMARLVRDLSKKIGKPVDFHTSGEDTELDKTVVDQIGDPLMHMIRNAVDHGIESSTEARVAAGKTAAGQITLRAFHQGGNIYIEIEDDGAGLNPERILKKARERGLISDDATPTEREIFDLIFAPGFSTAEKLTDVSGRGVGMDVVRRNVEALRGSIELRSELGRGTCFAMRLPLTLAIIEGMTVRVGGSRYIIPTLSIVELLRPKANDICTIRGRGEYFTNRGRQLALIRLSRLLGHSDAQRDPLQCIIVVVEDAGVMTGLLVDEVLGQQQAVIKSLGSRLENQPGLSGGAVMPDGRVGLILDVHGIVSVRNEESCEALQ